MRAIEEDDVILIEVTVEVVCVRQEGDQASVGASSLNQNGYGSDDYDGMMLLLYDDGMIVILYLLCDGQCDVVAS